MITHSIRPVLADFALPNDKGYYICAYCESIICHISENIPKGTTFSAKVKSRVFCNATHFKLFYEKYPEERSIP